MPASLQGTHVRTGEPIEVRLAGRRSLSTDLSDFSAVVFGAGDFRTRTEDRTRPPSLVPGDALVLGPLSATVTALLGHARLISLHFDGSTDEIWSGIAHHGRPVQYAHVPTPLALWDVWTPIASPPVAFEPPSAGFALDWQMIAALRARNIGFATITHAAGISSTGDAELDMRLPFDEPYEVPVSTAAAIARARANGGRIIAIGTTVVRALEHSAMRDGARTTVVPMAMILPPFDRARAIASAVETGTSYGSSNGSRMSSSASPVEEMPAACVIVANPMLRARRAAIICQSSAKPADGGSKATGGLAIGVHTSQRASGVGTCAYCTGLP